MNFSVDYDRAKCQERVGENDTKIWLTVWILRAKWWKRKNQKICAIRWARPGVCMGRTVRELLSILAWLCVCMARPCVLSGLRFLRFLCISPFSILNWLFKMFCGFWVMKKTLQVGLGEILRKFSITISKSSQNLWFDSKPQNMSTKSLIRMFKGI